MERYIDIIHRNYYVQELLGKNKTMSINPEFRRITSETVRKIGS